MTNFAILIKNHIMKFYYNDNYISINDYAIKAHKTAPYLLRKFNSGGISGIIVDGFRFVDTQNAAQSWYHVGLEDEKIFLPGRPEIVKYDSWITVHHYATKINRSADTVFSLIINKKMQCCSISGLIFVDGNIETHKELFELFDSTPHNHPHRHKS
jgi:hypothetical protein